MNADITFKVLNPEEPRAMDTSGLVTVHNTNTGNIGQLNTNWLQSDTATTNTDNWTGDFIPYVSPYVAPWYPYVYSNTVHICHCHWCSIEKKVRMTLKEVDTLRRAAKKDAKLREVLQRLTDFIEVEVEL